MLALHRISFSHNPIQSVNSIQASLPVNQIFFQAAPFQIPILAQLSNPPFKLDRNAELSRREVPIDIYFEEKSKVVDAHGRESETALYCQ